MNCINSGSTDPYFNLAFEELLLKKSKEEYLILYVNNPAVIIGKHQSAHQEVNTRFITEKHIPVIRRITGGGTVYHDNGNLNFSFIRQCESGKQVDFRKYTEPVISFLASLGVTAIFGGKNDLRVDGLKISGNAEHVYGMRVLHHGTILFNTSLDNLRNSIRKDKSHYSTRAVPSNPSPVMNLTDILKCYNDVSEFKSEMFNYMLKISDNIPYEPSEDLIHEAQSAILTKYKTWEWNWRYGPEYTFRNTFELNKRETSCLLRVKEGIIQECDLSGGEMIKRVSEKIPGCRHMVSDIAEVLRKENINLSEEEIYNFF